MGASNTSLEVVSQAALASRSAVVHRLTFTPAQEELIRTSFMPGATPEEAGALLEVARLRGLNPFLKQIHFVKRSTQRDGRYVDVWAFQVGIDGFRAIAERTGQYDGQDEIVTVEGPDGLPIASRCVVYRKDRTRPIVATARFREYAQYMRDGSLTKMWREKPFLMLEKCAEALGLRKAFPEDLSGLHEGAELGESIDTVGTPVPTLGASVGAAQLPAAVASVPESTPAAAAKVDMPSMVALFEGRIAVAGNAKLLNEIANEIGKAKEQGRLTPPETAALLKVWGARRSVLKAAVQAVSTKAPPPPSSPEPPASAPHAPAWNPEEQDSPPPSSRREREPGEEG
jgi:phage recombination protein Bet